MLLASLRLLRWNAVNSAVDAVPVVINAESRELSFEVKLVPEQYLVQQLLANRSDHPLNEGMRNRNVRNRLHLLNVEYAQVGQPAMKSEQGIVVGGKIFGLALLCPRPVEHPGDDWTINVATFNGKTDKTSTEHLYDGHHPVALKQDRFTAEQVQAPQTVLGVGECG